MRDIKLEVEIAADAAEVWRAVSTGEGIASWFAPIARVEPGKSIYIKWVEGMEGSPRIEIWEPEKQLRTVSDRPAPAPPGVIDYLIEGKGGETVMRLVHSGFESTANFDDEYNSTRSAWPVFLQMLKHSAEMGVGSCRNVSVFRMLGEPRNTAWKKLMQRLGGPVDGLVRHFDSQGLCLCYEYPAKGGAMLGVFCENCGGSAMLSVVWLLYNVTEADAEAVRSEWTGILDGMFGQAASAS
jgi:uncharacterized protein YndB with AHSA1/START domain